MSVKPSTKPSIKFREITVGEYIIALVSDQEIATLSKRLTRAFIPSATVLDTIPFIVVSRYEIDVKGLNLEKITKFIRLLMERIGELIYGYYVEEDKLVIYLKARKTKEIENYLNELMMIVKQGI